jgi:hypothetical protein
MTDLTPFYGVRVPAELRKTAKILQSGSIDQKTQFRKILEPVVVYAEKGDTAIDDGLLGDESMTLLAQVRHTRDKAKKKKKKRFFFLIFFFFFFKANWC